MAQTDFAEQEYVVRFLISLAGAGATIVATHISVVVIGSEFAYKLKRAIRFPYLDFSTPEKRLAMCMREVALNRAFAPALYLGAHRITREPGGALTLDGAGELVDALLIMRRFADEALFDDMARRDALTKPMMESLARRIAAGHNAATPDLARGGVEAMRRLLDGCASSLRAATIFAPGDVEALIAGLEAALETFAPLIDARRMRGKVRRCHGDLTLRNICLYEGEPTPFDCLEFDDDLATIDVLYDLAFLLMDLVRVDRVDFASLLFNRYLDCCDEADGLPLLPLFMALRATIRAHVEASQHHDDVAGAYFVNASRLLTSPKGLVLAIGGYSGAGKSSVAGALAPMLASPGARILNSDRIRKRLLGAAPTDRLSPDAYTSDVSRRVYRQMLEEANKAGSDWPVIVDAVFDRPEDRAEIETVAKHLGVPFMGVWLDVGFDQRATRVDARRNDVSDATREVLQKQMEKDLGEMKWRRIAAGRDVATIAAEIAGLAQGDCYGLAAAPPISRSCRRWPALP